MKIGIFGSTKITDDHLCDIAKDIGRLIAINKHILVTGGTDGFPKVVANSAIEHNGITVCYAVGKSTLDHLHFHNIDINRYNKTIFQKTYCGEKLSSADNYLRSLQMCQYIDMAIVIGGRVGTMYEVTIMSGLSKNLYILDQSGGVAGNTIKNFILEGHKTNSIIKYFNDPREIFSSLDNNK